MPIVSMLSVNILYNANNDITPNINPVNNPGDIIRSLIV